MGESGIAFVLGGGGHLGGYEEGMLRALFEAGVTPDIIIGTSVGSVQGAFAAADPSVGGLEGINQLWSEFVSRHIMKASPLKALTGLAQGHSYFGSVEPLRKTLTEHFGDRRIEDLAVRYQCVAASIERAAATYFDTGPLVPALLASVAVPGLWPPVELNGEHYIDGGVADSIPVDRAIELGAKTIYVLHVGRIDRPLRPPEHPWEVASVAFEIGRRHNFMDAMNRIPPGTTVHVLPTGEHPTEAHHHHLHNSQALELDWIHQTVAAAYAATSEYLAAQAG